MRKKILVFALAALCLSFALTGTLAFFTAEETAHNVITTGGVDIELLEWADEDKTEVFTDVIGVVPGIDVTKIVEVKNTGSAEAWVRLSASTAIILDEGVEGEVDLSLVTIDFNTTDWTLGEDGWYYYNKALKPGEITAPLFTTVSFAADMDNMYQNSDTTVDVMAMAVQSANNGIAATEAVGWPLGED